MKIYVFGNQDEAGDRLALQLAKRLQRKLDGVEFVEVKPNEDLPFAGEDKVVLMDVVKGLKEVRLLDENDLDKLKVGPKTTVHDFDLGWQLKYLRKLGKLMKLRIVGIPLNGNVEEEELGLLIRKIKF